MITSGICRKNVTAYKVSLFSNKIKKSADLLKYKKYFVAAYRGIYIIYKDFALY